MYYLRQRIWPKFSVFHFRRLALYGGGVAQLAKPLPVTAVAAGSTPVVRLPFFGRCRQWQTFGRATCGVARVVNATQPFLPEGVESFRFELTCKIGYSSSGTQVCPPAGRRPRSLPAPSRLVAASNCAGFVKKSLSERGSCPEAEFL